MKFSLTWLKDYLETTASVAEICDALNAIGDAPGRYVMARV